MTHGPRSHYCSTCSTQLSPFEWLWECDQPIHYHGRTFGQGKTNFFRSKRLSPTRQGDIDDKYPRLRVITFINSLAWIQRLPSTCYYLAQHSPLRIWYIAGPVRSHFTAPNTICIDLQFVRCRLLIGVARCPCVSLSPYRYYRQLSHPVNVLHENQVLQKRQKDWSETDFGITKEVQSPWSDCKISHITTRQPNHSGLRPYTTCTII